MIEGSMIAIYGIFNNEICLYVGATQHRLNRETAHKRRFGKECQFRVLCWTKSCEKAKKLERKFIKQYKKQGQAEFNGNPIKLKNARAPVSIDSKVHRALKQCAQKSGSKLNYFLDVAVRNYIDDWKETYERK